VRAALGLKPLADGAGARADANRREAEAGAQQRADAQRADAAAELAVRVAECVLSPMLSVVVSLTKRALRARERRELADSLRAQKTLADDDAAGDDAGAWIARSRALAVSKAETAKRDAAKAAAQRRAAALDEQDEGGSGDEDEEGRPRYTSKDLAGLKARLRLRVACSSPGS